MPTIEISKKDLTNLVGIKFNLDEALPLLKAEAEEDTNDKDKLKIEHKDINRPDLLCVEGMAREIRLKAGIEKNFGFNTEKQNKENIVKIDSSVKNVRPIIGCAIAKNVEISDDFLKQIIQLQEKLCENFGRRRKEAALGVYDYDQINWPIKYTTKDPNNFSFKPLGENKELTLKKILSTTEKGKEYGKIIEEFKEYPIIIDSKENVLSMPPIINSDYSGKITKDTKNLFIEVSGNNERFVLPVLNVIVLALIERGATIYPVELNYENKKMTTPILDSNIIKISPEKINKLLGIELKNKEIIALLKKSGYLAKEKTKDIVVEVPFYRQDILDERDIAEDIAIAYGYNELTPEIPEIFTIGKRLKNFAINEKISNLLIGLGLQEVSNFMLTNKETIFKKMNIEEKEIIEIENPMSVLYSCLRNSLIPSNLEFLADNKNSRYPQEIFEIGKIIELKNQKFKEKTNLTILSSSQDTNFTKMKQILDFLSNILDFEYNLEPIKRNEDEKNKTFIDGRVAKILLIKPNKKIKANEIEETKEIGLIGEIHPATLENFGLIMPASCLEINLDLLIY